MKCEIYLGQLSEVRNYQLNVPHTANYAYIAFYPLISPSISSVCSKLNNITQCRPAQSILFLSEAICFD